MREREMEGGDGGREREKEGEGEQNKGRQEDAGTHKSPSHFHQRPVTAGDTHTCNSDRTISPRSSLYLPVIFTRATVTLAANHSTVQIKYSQRTPRAWRDCARCISAKFLLLLEAPWNWCHTIVNYLSLSLRKCALLVLLVIVLAIPPQLL